MIATHNTLTCCPPLSPLHRLTAPIWRCQDQTFTTQLRQYEYFDLRIRFGKEGQIIFCHGLVDLNTGRLTLRSIMDSISFHGKKCRLLLERTTGPSAEDTFRDLVRYLITQYPDTLTFAAVKKGWKVLYIHPTSHPSTVIDHTYRPVDTARGLLYNILHFRISTPRRYARRHSPILTQRMHTDPAILHFIDFPQP